MGDECTVVAEILEVVWQVGRAPDHSLRELSVGNVAQDWPLAQNGDLEFLTVVDGHQDLLLLLLFDALVVVKVDCDV